MLIRENLGCACDKVRNKYGLGIDTEDDFRSAAGCAVIALFVAVGSWNSWFDTFLYNSEKQHLSTLQYELQKLLASAMNAGNRTPGGAGSNAGAASGAGNVATPQSIRAAFTVVTAVPILIVYPFLQRYFVNGLAIGGVKE